MQVSLQHNVMGKNRFVGKIIDGIYYREFDFRRAVLWKTKELSMDKKVWESIRDHIYEIVFSDTHHKLSYHISKEDFDKKSRSANNNAGEQMYIPIDQLSVSDFIVTPYVSEVKQI